MVFTVLRWLFWCGILGVAAVAGIFIYFSDDLPSPSKLEEYNPATVTRLYAEDGSLFKEYASEHRIYMPIDEIPQVVIDAFIAAEDRNFFEHAGVDPTGILRALVNNLRGDAGMQGASTITQQVIKNVLLTKERTFKRKIKEAILAFQLTAVYSKQQVLELYLNHIFLGARSYGVGSAALHYFNKNLSDLTPEEAALLAAMPKAPSALSPWRHYERALHRRNWVLERMADENFITGEQYEQLVRTPINLADARDKYVVEADYFAEEVRKQLVDKWGEDKVYKDGLSVHSTLSPSLQSAAEKSLIRGLVSYDRRQGSYRGGFAHIGEEFIKDGTWLHHFNEVPLPHVAEIMGWDMYIILGLEGGQAKLADEKGNQFSVPFSTIKHQKGRHKVGDIILMSKQENGYRVEQAPGVNGAMVVMDPTNGEVLAMVGGHSPDFSAYNRATQAKRQPGSSFKPYTYTAALERGFTPASLVADEPFSITVGDKVWSPKNYHGTFYGPITLRDGLERSINVMSVNLAMMTGIKNVTEMAYRLGAYEEEPSANLATVLGTEETTLIRMAGAYSTFANGGYKVEPHLISRVLDREGKPLFVGSEFGCDNCTVEKNFAKATPPDIEDDAKLVLRPENAYQITHMLEGVVDRGTAASLRKYGIPLAAKTGTTNETRDTWIIGFTPALVMAVFVGYDQPRSLGKNEQSATVAAPVLRNFVEEALEEIPLIPFPIPDGISLVRVDHQTGYLPSAETNPRDIIVEAFVHGTEPTSTAPAGGVRPLTEAPSGGGIESLFQQESTPPATGVY